MADPIRIPIIYEEDTSGIIKATEALRENQKAVNELEKTQKDAFEGSVDSINEYTQAIEEAGREQAANEQAAKSLSKQIIDGAKNYRIFGTSLNDVIGKLRAKQAALKTVIAGLRGGAGALQLFKAALISTGIGALVVALGSVVAFLTKTQKGIEIVNKVMAGFSATVNVVIDRAAKFGEILFGIFDRPLIETLGITKDAFSGITDEIAREVDLAIQLEEQLQAIEKATILLNIQTAARRAEIKELNKVAEDTTKTEKERIEAAKGAIGIEQELLDKRLENQRALLANKLASLEFTGDIEEQLNRIARGAVSADEIISNLGLSNSTTEDLKEFANIAVDFFNTQTESLELQTTLNNKLNTITQEGARRRQQALEEERRRIEALQKEYDGLFNTLQEQLQSAELSGLGIFDRIDREEELALEALEKFRLDLVEAAGKLGIEKDFSEDFERLAANIRQESETARDAALQAARDVNNALQRGLENAANGGEGTVNAERLGSAFDDDFQKRFSEIMSERLAAGIGEGAEGAANSDSLFDSLARLKETILDGLGIEESELKAILGGIETVFSSFLQNRAELLNAELAAQDEILNRIDERVDQQQEALDRELQLKLAGYANDYEALKSNLDATLTEQEEAERKRAQIAAEARKQQERLDTAQQVSSLITASSNIYKAFSAIPFVGVPLAIAAIGAMLLNFAKTKSEVKKLSKPEFGQGQALDEYFSGEAKGDKHGVPGTGRGMKGRTANGDEFLFEGSEFIVNSKDAREQKKALHAINDGEYRGVDLDYLLRSASESMAYGMPSVPLPEAIPYMSNLMPGVRKSAKKLTKATAKKEASLMVSLKGEIHELRKDLNGVKRAIEEKPDYVPVTPDGYIKFGKSGNTRSVGLYDAPKRKGG